MYKLNSDIATIFDLVGNIDTYMMVLYIETIISKGWWARYLIKMFI